VKVVDRHRIIFGWHQTTTFILVSVILVASFLKPGQAVQGTVTESPITEVVIIETEEIFGGFNLLVDIKLDDDGRFFVAQMDGIIRVIDTDGTTQAQPLLDISDQITFSGELGLSSIALHPQFNNNGRFFVNYDTSDYKTLLVEYISTTTKPFIANPESARIILELSQPSNVHNGADMEFGPDGYLYAGFGDGGGGNDPNNNAQNGQTLLGTILRLDVDSNQPYGIPADNPFVGDVTVLDEIWAIGLRNPWRFSFDRVNGDFFIADVGENTWEEVNHEAAPLTGGKNYGWRCYEGFQAHITNGCQGADAYTDPIYVLRHPEVRAFVGGYVYRGDVASPIYGHYIFGDYVTGKMWGLTQSGEKWLVSSTGEIDSTRILTFGEGPSGELYVTDFSKIFEIGASTIPVTPTLYLPSIIGN
jgi:glucose/arabinose dehydrogenase